MTEENTLDAEPTRVILPWKPVPCGVEKLYTEDLRGVR